MKKRIREKLLVVLFIILFIISSYFGYNYLSAKSAKNKKDKIYQNYEETKEVITQVNTQNVQNSENVAVVQKEAKVLRLNDIRATIKVLGTNIDAFVMQSGNNTFYLNHSEDGNYNELGSLMLDYRSNLDTSKISIIYGHNTYYVYTPFKELEKYYDKSFYGKNRYIEIDKNGQNLQYEIFTVALVPKKTSRHIQTEFTSDEALLEHLQWLREISLYDTGVVPEVNDNILLLQTCSLKYDGNFLIIGGRKVR